MSRIGKKEITIPKNVSVHFNEKKIIITGKYGTLEFPFFKGTKIEKTEQKISIVREDDSKNSRACHGLVRALIQNMVLGVDQKFFKTLIAEGVGYKFQVEKNMLLLSMGYSHLIKMSIPDDLTIKLESATKIIISGIEKQKVGLFASKVREVRPPEPYKGKGIRYEGEVIRRKAGKTGK